MTSAVPGASLHLVSLAGQATSGISGAVVADGWTDQRAPVMFGVGTAAPPFFENEQNATVEGAPTWAGLGAKHIQEDLVIHNYIYVGEGSSDYAIVRTKAFAVWDAFLPLLIADLTLGGALTGGRFAEVDRFTSTGPRSALEAEGGRFCLIQFDIRCTNLT